MLSSVNGVRKLSENFHSLLLGKVVNVQIASDFVFIPKGEYKSRGEKNAFFHTFWANYTNDDRMMVGKQVLWLVELKSMRWGILTI